LFSVALIWLPPRTVLGLVATLPENKMLLVALGQASVVTRGRADGGRWLLPPIGTSAEVLCGLMRPPVVKVVGRMA
jgi:hypothetical protein